MSVVREFRRDIIIALVALIGLLIAGLIPQSSWARDFLTSLFAYGLMAMSLNLLIGYIGLVSFGHAAFFVFGAYAFGLQMQWDAFTSTLGGAAIPVALILTVGMTGAYALAIGAICARLSEIYFAFLTLAFQMFLYSIILSAVGLTGGDQGLTGGIPRPPFFGINLADSHHRFAFCAVLFVICILLMRILTQSSFGYSLRMIRDNPQRAAFLGVNVQRVKIICFVISGVIAGIGGIILTIFTSGAYPEWGNWAQSGEAIFMIMLGGVNSFLGPLLGALMLRVLSDLALIYTTHTGLVIGMVILFVVLGLRMGVLDYIAQFRQNRNASFERITASKPKEDAG